MKQLKIIDSLTIPKILALWLLGVLLFGLIYFGLNSTNNPLTIGNEPLTKDANGFANSIYFSFITAMTIGYNDIVPTGYSKLLVILEAIFSMAFLGLLLAKFVSIRQEEIIQEFEELSFEEATNSAISELYIFRSDAKTIVDELHNEKKNKSSKFKDQDNTIQLKNFEQSLDTFKLAIQNIERATCNLTAEQKHNGYLRIELLLNSITFSLSRMIEMLEAFDYRKTVWKKESTTATLVECRKIMQNIHSQYDLLKSGEHQAKIEEKLEDLNITLKTLETKI
jgi:hypothetical protein